MNVTNETQYSFCPDQKQDLPKDDQDLPTWLLKEYNKLFSTDYDRKLEQ